MVIGRAERQSVGRFCSRAGQLYFLNKSQLARWMKIVHIASDGGFLFPVNRWGEVFAVGYDIIIMVLPRSPSSSEIDYLKIYNEKVAVYLCCSSIIRDIIRVYIYFFFFNQTDFTVTQCVWWFTLYTALCNIILKP